MRRMASGADSELANDFCAQNVKHGRGCNMDECNEAKLPQV